MSEHLNPRTPIRFRERVISQFRSQGNIAYLEKLLGQRLPKGALARRLLSALPSAALEFSGKYGRAYDVLLSDPVARRGGNRPAQSLWAEVRRLNRAFFEDRLALSRDRAEGRAPRDGVGEDEEPYGMRMFISDSLRPPGLEHLNTPGPLYELREDQSTWVPRDHEKFSAHREEEDSPWDAGDPNRTPEQAIAEYWGDDWTVSETTTGAPETGGRAYGSMYAWGDDWLDNGGTRLMRYDRVPFWQQGGREGVDYDIEETLGTSGRELDGQVRRWDTDRVREPRGQEYRRFGPRTGHVV